MSSPIPILAAGIIRPLSLQAAAWGYVSQPYAIQENGCMLPNGTINCQQACLDPDNVFSNGATLQNCLAYPIISKYLSNPNATSSNSAALQYGYVPNDVNGSRAIIDVVVQCYRGYRETLPDCILDATGNCERTPYPGCNEALAVAESTGEFPANTSDPYAAYTFQCTNSFCNYVAQNTQVSSDVGGIGVWISYVIQISLVILAWLIVEYFRILHPYVLKRLKRKGPLAERIARSTQKDMFMETLIDFHKCQCYFMSTILLAAIVATQQGNLGASTLQDLFANFVLLAVLAIGGSIPIIFVLFKLRLLGHRSWYTFLLSTITLVLAFALVWSGGPHKTISTELLDPNTSYIPSCGTITPASLCLQGFYDSWQPGPGTTYGHTADLYSVLFLESYAAFAVSLVLYIGLFIDQIYKIDISVVRRVLRKPATRQQEIETAQGALRHDLWITLPFGFFNLVASIGSVVIMAYYLKSLARFGIGSLEWSFGQIVALTIWIPPIVQYCYLQLHGVEGNRWHLPKTLKVVREAPDEDEDETASTRGRQRDEVSMDSLDPAFKNGEAGSRLSEIRVPAQRNSSRVSERDLIKTSGSGAGHSELRIRQRSISRTPLEERKELLGTPYSGAFR